MAEICPLTLQMLARQESHVISEHSTKQDYLSAARTVKEASCQVLAQFLHIGSRAVMRFVATASPPDVRKWLGPSVKVVLKDGGYAPGA